MNSPALSVHTPQGDSGSVLVGADDYLFRYDAKAQAQSAISLTMPVRAEEYLPPRIASNLSNEFARRLRTGTIA